MKDDDERMKYLNNDVLPEHDKDMWWREVMGEENRITKIADVDETVNKYFDYMGKNDTFGTRFQLKIIAERVEKRPVYVWRKSSCIGLFELAEVFNKQDLEEEEGEACHVLCDLNRNHYETFVAERYTSNPEMFRGLQVDEIAEKVGRLSNGRNGKYNCAREEKFIFGCVPVYNSKLAAVSTDTAQRPWLLKTMLVVHRRTGAAGSLQPFTT